MKTSIKAPPKPSSQRQNESRRKPLDELDRAAEAMGLPTGRNRRPENSRILREFIESYGLPTPPEMVFDFLSGSLLHGLVHIPGEHVTIRNLWVAILEVADDASSEAASKLRESESRLIQRLKDQVGGWCIGINRAKPEGISRIEISEGNGDGLLMRGVRNDGQISGFRKEMNFGAPDILEPKQKWLDREISDHEGSTLINAVFTDFLPGTLQLTKSSMDLRLTLKFRERRQRATQGND